MTEDEFDIDAYLDFVQEIYEDIYYDLDSPGYMDYDKTYEMMQQRL